VSQTLALQRYLAKGRSITPMDALKLFGCFRLGARIYDLKRAGWNIVTSTVSKNGKRFAEYRMVKSNTRNHGNKS
jgi:hypothetical protein